MPQPFGPFYRPHFHYEIGADSLKARPELAALIAQSLAVWNASELQMSLVLAAMLKADTSVAVDMFLAIKSSQTQREALSAVAKGVLAPADADMFDAVLAAYKSLERQRNKIAHGIYGHSNHLPDAILWADIHDFAGFLTRTYAAEYAGSPLEDPHAALRECMYVYTQRDLLKLVADLNELHEAVMLFHFYQQPRPDTAQHRDRLVALPLVRRALDRTAVDWSI